MNRAHTNLAVAALLFGCAALLAACFAGPRPGTLHALRPLARERLGPEFTSFHEMILVMPVRLAPQLQGRGLLLPGAAGEITASLSHRWAGPLDQLIALAIADNLKTLLGTDNVAVFPGPRYGITRYQLEVEISEFGGDAGAFTLRAVQTLNDAAGKAMLQRKSFNNSQRIDKSDSSGYVEAASQAVAKLSFAAAEALIAARQSQPAPRSHYEN